MYQIEIERLLATVSDPERTRVRIIGNRAGGIAVVIAERIFEGTPPIDLGDANLVVLNIPAVTA